MRVAIVDDLRTDAELLQGMLRTRLPAGCFVDVYESGRAFLTSEVKHDLVFMDVVMDGMNGIEAAQALRERDMACLLVFLTTSREYAWDAFPVHPFDYLIKPVEEGQVCRVLEEARRTLERQERVLPIKVGRQQAMVSLSEVRYAYVRDHFVFLRLTDGREIKCYMTFAEMLAKLEKEPRFLVCNRGVLLNMDEVRSFDGQCFVMSDGQQFTVRLHEKAQIGQRFYQYTFRKARGVE